MKISVLIPTLNSEKYLIQSIESVLAQDYTNFEIIFIDKSSTDKTLEIINSYINKFPDKISLHNQDKGNLTTAFNMGVDLAKGDFFIVLGSDDVFNLGCFSKVNNAYKKSKSEFIFSNTQIFDENSKVYKTWNTNLKSVNSIFFHRVLGHQALFMKTDLIKKVGYFDESFKYAMDYDIIVKGLLNSKFCYVDDYFCKFRMSGDNLTSKYIFDSLDEKEKIIRKFCPKLLLPFSLIYLNLVRVKKYFSYR